MAEADKYVLVYGGGGALGRELVTIFKNANFKVSSVDVVSNSSADMNILVSGTDMHKDATKIKKELGNQKLDALLCVAGGWLGGDIASEETFASIEKMWKFNLQSAVTAAHVAAHFLKENALLVFTGASAALDGTPGMIGYGVSKAATHHLVKSLVDQKSGLPNGVTVIAILPVILDTPSNRSAMPTANYANWTPVVEVAKKLLDWTNRVSAPATGSFLEVRTKDHNTQWVPVTYQYTKDDNQKV
jgi:dihydropteridine reductase